MQNGVVLHHVGYVVESITACARSFAESLALDWDGRIIHDPRQKVCVSFFTPQSSGNPVIELVEPAGDSSRVRTFLEQGGGLHHLCYEVDSLEQQLAWAKNHGDRLALPPLPAVAFGGRRIAWILTRQRLLIEYLERKAPEPAA